MIKMKKNKTIGILKKIPVLFMSVVLTFISIMPVAAEEAFEKPQVDHTPYTYTVNPGDIFNAYYSFQNYYQNDNPVYDFVFKITDIGELTIVEGSETNNGLGYYNFKYGVPENPTVSTIYIRYTASFKYKDDKGKEQSESKNYSTKVDIRKTEVTETGKVSIVNVKSQETGIGQEPTINAQIVNTLSYSLKDAVVKVLNDNGSVIARNYIGKIAPLSESSAYDVALTVPSYNTAGDRAVTLQLEYNDKDDKMQTIAIKHTLNITEGEPLSLEGFNPPAKITVGNQSEFSFNLINKSNTEYKNAQLYFYEGENLLHTQYIGIIPVQQQTDVKFNYTFISTGTANYKVEVLYENPADKALSVQHSEKLTVYESSPMELNNITPPEKVIAKTLMEIKFNLINKSETNYTNAEAYLYDGKTLLESVYIGNVTAQSQIPGVISHSFEKSGKNKYTLAIKYNDAIGKQKTISKEFELDIDPFEGDEDETGALKIQTINPPVEALVSSSSTFMFAITNPTSVALKGVEVFVFDEKGNQLNSIYISEIGANSSYTNESMSLKTAETAGVFSYTLKVLYKDNDEKEYTLSKSFSINTVLEKKEEKESDYPANIKIQKINNPAVMYTNVKTNVPVILVNAGKGTAYNVEIYVLDSNGNEMAREYIGTIKVAEKIESSFLIKYILTGEYDATLHVVYENYDDSVSYAEKPYSQQVIDYRASITDIAGYEYLEVGYQYNIEFSIINNGTEKLLNTTAILKDRSGTQYAELFIGTIEPGSKKERQRFRNIIFNTPGELDLTVSVTYENEDMQVFDFESSVAANVNQPYVPDMNMDVGSEIIGGDGSVDVGNMENGGVPEAGLEWWVLALIIGGGTVVLLVVVIIVVKKVRKKGKTKNEDDDIEYFLKQIARDKGEGSNGDKNDSSN